MDDALIIGEAEAFEEPTAKPDAGEPKPASSDKPDTARDDDDDWKDRPGWTKQWKKPSQSALRELRRLDAENKFLPEVLKEVETRYDYTGKQASEFDKYRKRFDPYDQVLGSLEQRFALQGVHPAAGLQQLAAFSDYLQRDPDQALAELASRFKPRDAKRFVQSLSQTLGIDLSSVAAAQPWIDPAVKQLIEPLQNQYNQLLGLQQQQHQQQWQYASQQVTSSIKAFEEAQDESGNPKYPHFQRLQGAMTNIINAITARRNPNEQMPSLEQVYDQALWADPELRETAIEERARRAEAKAIQDANKSQASVEEATRASRNISGSKTVPNAPKFKNDREAFNDTWDKLSRK